MTTIKHTPRPTFENDYTISGNNIDELIAYCLPKIREKSKEAYAKLLKEDLTNEGVSIIDRHAGLGYTYSVIYTAEVVYADEVINVPNHIADEFASESERAKREGENFC